MLDALDRNNTSRHVTTSYTVISHTSCICRPHSLNLSLEAARHPVVNTATQFLTAGKGVKCLSVRSQYHLVPADRSREHAPRSLNRKPPPGDCATATTASKLITSSSRNSVRFSVRCLEHSTVDLIRTLL
jgi:hypothetical protein